jgi:hypothetical protein
VRTTATAGIAFDAYAPNDFKLVALDVAGQRVVIGHVDPRRGYVIDASASRVLAAGTDLTLTATLRGSTVSVAVGGVPVLAFAYDAAITDGATGLVTRGGSGSFDRYRLRTDDPALASVQALQSAKAKTATSAFPDAAATGQLIFLDLDGATGVTYDGPVSVDRFDIPALTAPGALAGRETEMRAPCSRRSRSTSRTARRPSRSPRRPTARRTRRSTSGDTARRSPRATSPSCSPTTSSPTRRRPGRTRL